MPQRDKIILAIAVAVAGFLAYTEFFAPAPTPTLAGTCKNPNALGIPAAAPSLSTLTTAQAGSGLFGNPSGQGSNTNAGQTVSGPVAELPTILETPVTSTLKVQPLQSLGVGYDQTQFTNTWGIH